MGGIFSVNASKFDVIMEGDDRVEGGLRIYSSVSRAVWYVRVEQTRLQHVANV